MILAEVVLGALLLSLLTGGSLATLARERLRGEFILLLLFPVQLAWPQLAASIGLRCFLATGAWLLMMAALVVVLCVNAPKRWMLIVAAAGIAANIFVISLNQAMPVSITAASEISGSRAAARAALAHDCLHEEMDGQTTLAVLCDRIAVPGPAWQRSVVSVGDLLLSVGLAFWLFAASRDKASFKRECC